MDWVIGAKVRVTAELVEPTDPADADDLRAQRRAGAYSVVSRLVRLELVAEAARIEGTVRCAAQSHLCLQEHGNRYSHEKQALGCKPHEPDG